MKRFYAVFVLVFLFHSQILSQTVSEGVYIIRLAANPSFVVGINGKVQSGANIVLQTNSGADSQKWRIVHNNGAIILACVANSNCAMDIWGGKPKAGSNIACYSKHDGNNQKWYAEKYGNGYVLRSALNKNYVLDLDHAIAKNGQNILLWPEHKGEGQIWKLERVNGYDGKNNKSSEDKVVDAFNKFFNGANSPTSDTASNSHIAPSSGSAKVQNPSNPTSAKEQFDLAVDYYYGFNGKKVNKAEAVKWWRKAADQGHTHAQFCLGVCYYDGEGVQQNYAEAVKWLRKAADQGYASAQYYLGVCFDKGLGVKQNYAEAVKWWRKAAEQGKASAQYNLGMCYATGDGVQQNYAEAVKWLEKAKTNPKATEVLKKDIAKAIDLIKKVWIK